MKFTEFESMFRNSSNIKMGSIKKYFIFTFTTFSLLAFAHCTTTSAQSKSTNFRNKRIAERQAKKKSNSNRYAKSHQYAQTSQHDEKNCSCCCQKQHDEYVTTPSNAPENLDNYKDYTGGQYNENSDAYTSSYLPTNQSAMPYNLEGIASWYGRDFNGKITASGEVYNSNKLTAAHKTLPLGSIIAVHSLDTNKSVQLRINDRGPYVEERILDVSEYASRVLGFKEVGLAKVRIKVIKMGEQRERKDKGLTYERFSATKKESSLGSWDLDEDDYLNLPAVPLEKKMRDFSLQLGAFSNYEHASVLEKRLSYYNEEINIYRRGDKYILYLGKFRNRTQAAEMKGKLSQDGYSSFVVAPTR